MANTNDESFYDSVAASSPEYRNDLATLSEAERAKQEELWKAELIRLDEEIGTLKSVLNAKINEATELKRKLGITPMVELREDLKHSWQAIRESETVQKTNSALKTFGAFASKKMGDLKNSNAFKSVEGKVGGAYTSIKQSRSMGNMKSKWSTLSSSQSERDMAGVNYGVTDGLLDEKDDDMYNSVGGGNVGGVSPQ